MLKTSTEAAAGLTRHVLNGATMGTRYSAIFLAPKGEDVSMIGPALFAAVDRVDQQMSTWKPTSDLMRLNRAPRGIWQALPRELMTVLTTAMDIGERSDGLFDIGVGDLVGAWGFGAEGRTPDQARIAAGLSLRRTPAHTLVELDAKQGRARRHGVVQLDLSGIAKGFGADEMMRCLTGFGITRALVSLDGELSARGLNERNMPWAVGVERPDFETRDVLGVIDLVDAAVATSGDYRHWVDVGKMRLSHTMDPRLGGPMRNRVASVSVVHPLCMYADAWATACMVAGEDAGPELARRNGLSALFLLRDGGELREIAVGPMFEGPQLGAPQAAKGA